MIKEGIKIGGAVARAVLELGRNKEQLEPLNQSINIAKKHHPTNPLLKMFLADEMCERGAQLPSFRDTDDRPSQTVICKKWFAYVWVCADLRSKKRNAELRIIILYI